MSSLPQVLAVLLQPEVQRCQIREVGHLLPQAWTGILNVFLDLPFLPARSRIAELRCKDVVVRHRKEPDVDLSLLAPADAIDRCLHIIVDAASRDAAEHTEAVPMGVKQHLVRLQQIRPDQKRATVR